MNDNDKQFRAEDIEFGRGDGLVILGVPRGQAAEVRRRLECLGIGSSLHQDPASEHTVVLPRTNLSPARVRDLLTGAGWPRRE